MTEGVDLLIAGSDTTAASASTAVLQILQHPDVHKKLVDSLDAAIPSADHMPSLIELEKIDYLVRMETSYRSYDYCCPCSQVFAQGGVCQGKHPVHLSSSGSTTPSSSSDWRPVCCRWTGHSTRRRSLIPTSRNPQRFWCPVHSEVDAFQPWDHMLLTAYMLSTDDRFHVFTHSAHQRRCLGTRRSTIQPRSLAWPRCQKTRTVSSRLF